MSTRKASRRKKRDAPARRSEPIGAEPGGVRGLGAILHDLRAPFPDAGWHAYLENLLTDQLGGEPGNTIAHGLRPRLNPIEAALLIHAACYLRLLELQAVKHP